VSQYGISQWVYELFDKKPGVFLEIGGSMPDNQSNTKFLEDNGWTGLCVEPLTIYNEDYKRVRPKTILENYALVDKNYTEKTITAGIDYHCSGVTPDHTNGKLSNIREVSQWPVCQLQVLLKKHNLRHIDFFSLDTEGYEHHVLDGTDFNFTIFNLILIETHGDYAYVNKTNDFSYLENYGYNYQGLFSSGYHKIYTHKTFNYEKN